MGISIVTGRPVPLIIDFYKMPENTRLHLWPYNFAIFQNGKEIHRTNGMAELGASTQKYTFGSGGKTIIKIENAQNPSSCIQFGTIVYKNQSGLTDATTNTNNGQGTNQSVWNTVYPLMLVYFVYAVIIVIPLAAACVHNTHQ